MLVLCDVAPRAPDLDEERERPPGNVVVGLWSGGEKVALTEGEGELELA